MTLNILLNALLAGSVIYLICWRRRRPKESVMTAYYSDKELKLLESKNTAATTVDIINPGAPVDVDAKEFVDGKGRRRIEITLDGAVAAALACPGSATRAAQRGAYGGSKAR